MRDTQELLDRQRRWHSGRKDLTWEEKVHMAERVRQDISALKSSGGSSPQRPSRRSEKR